MPQLDALLDVAARFEALDRAGRSTGLLPDQLAYALFFDNSTRTKSAWAGAAARLGMRPVIVDGTSTQVAHGETAAETGAMLGMNAHALGVRHDLILGEGNRFMRERQARHRRLPGGHGRRAHGAGRQPAVRRGPSDADARGPALAARALRRALSGKRIAVSWAYSPSYAKPLSVPQGLITLLTRFGAHVTLAHPDGYRLLDECIAAAERTPPPRAAPSASVTPMDEAFERADAVYPKSWGPYDLMLERVEANRRGDQAALKALEKRALTQNAQHRDWICDERRMGQDERRALPALPARRHRRRGQSRA